MKIYQLHEYSGEWEDFRDNIIGFYLRKERAREEKIKAEAKEVELKNKSNDCLYCPFLDDTELSLENLLTLYPDYCTDAELEETKYGINCENYFSKYDDSTFKIIEIEVEE